MRTSSRPARARTRLQGSKMLESRCPVLVPGMTQGLQGTRGMAARTSAASTESEIVRGPVLLSAQTKLLRLQVHVVPAQREDLVAPAAGEHEQADGRRRMGRKPPGRLQLVQGRT